MERYSKQSNLYSIKEGFFNRSNRNLFLEIIMNEGYPMTNAEQIKLAYDMLTLYKTWHWDINIKYFLHSIKYSSYITLVTENNTLLANYFTSKRHIQKPFNGAFYYTERICMHKSLSPVISLLCPGITAYYLPEFRRKRICITSIAKEKSIENLLNLFGSQILNSDRDWSELSSRDKDLVKNMIFACLCCDSSKIFAPTIEKGIIKDIYKDVYEPGYTPYYVSYNKDFTQYDGRFLINEIPASKDEIMKNFYNNKKLSKSEFLQEFMNQFMNEENLFNNLELVRS